MAIKKGLGRGLDALLGEYTTAPSEGVHEIDINMIDINLEQPRKAFDEEKLKELCESIKENGIVQPIIVRRVGERYSIVAGERRYRASRLAGLTAIPAIIREFEEDKLMQVALIENIQRENLNSMEIAAAIDMLVKEHNLTHEEIATRIGKSRVSVTQLHRLTSLPEEVQDFIRQGKLQFGHARPLVGVGDAEKQMSLAKRAVEANWTSRELEAQIAQETASKKTADGNTPLKDAKRNLTDNANRVQNEIIEPTSRVYDLHRYNQPDPDIVYSQDEMRRQLGVKVTIRGTVKKGSVVIDYYSEDQLQGIYELLMQRKKLL